MADLAPYLPACLVEAIDEETYLRKPPFVNRFEAALLFSDISGFTALTEKLQRFGRAGAEEITDVVKAAFRPAIQAIHRHGGSVVTFGGDALFVLFPGKDPVRRAEAAAGAILRHFDAAGEVATRAGTSRLRISQAIHYGRVLGMHLGTPDRRRFLACGPSVQALARLESKAQSSEILQSRAARRRRRKQGTASPATASAAGASDARLAPYVPKHVLAVRDHFHGAFRPVAMLFLETRGYSLPLLQRFVLALYETLDRYQGILVSPDLSKAGTKWLCAFGTPVAHEDDAERAALAAIDMASRFGVRVRGGIQVGTAANIWVGTEARLSFEVMGDVTNTSARTAAKAAWGEILLTEAVKTRLSSIVTEDRGRHAAKGKREPLHLHAARASKTGVKTIRTSIRLIGRDRELALLAAALDRAKQGTGAVIGITGDAGLGKSRLVHEAANKARHLGFAVHEGRASSLAGIPYQCIGSLIKDALSLADSTDKSALLDQVSTAARELRLKDVDRHHLAELLGARYKDSPIEHLDARSVRLNNNLAVREFFSALARKQPRMLVLEDLHAADSGSVEAARRLANATAEARILLLLVYRPPPSGKGGDDGYKPPGGTQELVLEELTEAAVRALLAAHLGNLPESVDKLVRERASGNPFYIEELVRHLIETGALAYSDNGYELTRTLHGDDLPPGIESLVAARLDRLSPSARDVANHASVIGRTFLLALLRHLQAVAAKLDTGVAELAAQNIVFRRPGKAATYLFRHTLTRDVAYAGMLVRHRRRIHAAVAEAIEAVFAMDRESHLAELGHHLEQAGKPTSARECFLGAARAAARRYSYDEAEVLYRACLRLHDQPTIESVKARNELGSTVLGDQGRVREAEAEHRLAIEEARGLKNESLHAQGLRDLGMVMSNTGRMKEARSLLEQALTITRSAGDRPKESQILANLAYFHRVHGRMEEARSLFSQSLAIAREEGDRKAEGITLESLASLDWQESRMEAAQKLYEQALPILREQGDRRYEGILLGNLAGLQLQLGRMKAAEALFEEALSIAREVGNRRNEAIVLGNLAIVHLHQGRQALGQAFLEQALAIHRDVEDPRNQALVLGNLAGVHVQRGQPAKARELYEEALSIHRSVGDRRNEGTILGNMGMLLSDQGALQPAKNCLDAALSICREVGDRIGEGAVLANLATLQRRQGEMEKARGIYLEARTLQRDIGNRHYEGIILGNLASLELIASSNLARATEYACQGEQLLRQVGEKLELCKLLASRGHIQLAGGKSAAPFIAEVESIAQQLSLPADSKARTALDALKRAETAFEAGLRLVCGYVREDISDVELRWLSEHRPEALQG